MDKYLKELQEATLGGRSICKGVIGDIDGKTYLLQMINGEDMFHQDIIRIDNLNNLKKPGGISIVYKFSTLNAEMRRVTKMLKYIKKIDEGQLRVPAKSLDWISIGKSQMIDNLKGWKLFPDGSSFDIKFKFLNQAIKYTIPLGSFFTKYKGTMKRIK